MKFTLGSDPELFLINKNNKYISSIGKIGGSKKQPLPISELGEGFCVQEDNVAVEFNIPPASSEDAFVLNLSKMLEHLENKARGMGLRLAVDASARFDLDELNNPNALEMGCDADFNAWTGDQNPKPNASDKQLRSCGGHVHIGTDLDAISVIRACDLFLGVPASLFDTDTRRRALYGSAGAFRWTSFGCEYRVLSNAWLKSPDRMRWVHRQTAKALALVATQKDAVEEQTFLDDYADDIVAAINTGNEDARLRLNMVFNILEGSPT